MRAQLGVMAILLSVSGCVAAPLRPETIVPEAPPPMQAGLAGVVADVDTSEPLPNALVLVEGTGDSSTMRETTTNSAGRYAIPDLPAGTYTVMALYAETESKQVVVHDGKAGMRVDFELDRDATPITSAL